MQTHEIFLNITIKIPDPGSWRHFGVFNVNWCFHCNFEQPNAGFKEDCDSQRKHS